MKKLVAFILAILYLSTSMGATIHFHYCMGQLVSWGLIDHTGAKSCEFCGMPKMGASGNCMVGMRNCCHEEHKQIKNNSDQKFGQEASWFWTVVSRVADLPQAARVMDVPVSPVISHPVAHGPPLAYNVLIFLRNRSFRI